MPGGGFALPGLHFLSSLSLRVWAGVRETNEKLIMFDTLSKAGKYLGQAAKMMIGVPDYDNYVEHMRVNHPDQTPMTYEDFFRDRQDARYGGKGGARCC